MWSNWATFRKHQGFRLREFFCLVFECCKVWLEGMVFWWQQTHMLYAIWYMFFFFQHFFLGGGLFLDLESFTLDGTCWIFCFFCCWKHLECISKKRYIWETKSLKIQRQFFSETISSRKPVFCCQTDFSEMTGHHESYIKIYIYTQYIYLGIFFTVYLSGQIIATSTRNGG